MTPKEKAKELVNKYEDYVRIYNDDTPRLDMQKQCALIAINEMTKYNPNIYHNDMVKDKYWNEVKKQIEKL